MKSLKDDRRSKRTRQLLGNAFVDLMLEKHYDDITIQNILDRADIGRSTFYAHFTDKEDLLTSQLDQLIHQLEIYTAKLGHIHSGLLPSLELFRHVKEQRRLVQAFVWGRGSEILMRDFQEQVRNIVGQNIATLIGDSPSFSIPLPVVTSFITSTFLMLLIWWLEQDMRETPEHMDDMFQKLIMPSIRALF